MLESQFEGTVLVFEAVSGGGMVGQPLPASLRREGTAIRRAVVADFAAVSGVRVLEPVDARCLDDRPGLPNVTRIIADPAQPIDLATLVRPQQELPTGIEAREVADWAVIVAPETDGMLVGFAGQVEAVSGQSLGATAAAIALCANKLALAEHFARVGVPTPPTTAWHPSDGWPPAVAGGDGIVLKPVDGAGSVATFVCSRSAPCPASWLGRSGGIVQPFRSGPSLSASFLVGRDGRAHLIAVGRQAVTIGPTGAVEYQGGEVPVPFPGADLGTVRHAVESVPGLLGFIGVDFIAVEPTGAVEVIEINPRVTTSIVALGQLGPPGTLARAWLALALGGETPDDGADIQAIRTALPLRFRADGLIQRSLRARS